MSALPTGRLAGIAVRAERRAPMREIAQGVVTTEAGLGGDHKGAKFPRRQITILAEEDWQETLTALAEATAGRETGNPDPLSLPWTARRANLLTSGVRLPRARNALIRIGPVLLQSTFPTVPCSRMDEALPGLRRALAPNWRGGLTCRVVEGGPISLGDAVEIVLAPPDETYRRLPG